MLSALLSRAVEIDSSPSAHCNTHAWRAINARVVLAITDLRHIDGRTHRHRLIMLLAMNLAIVASTEANAAFLKPHPEGHLSYTEL